MMPLLCKRTGINFLCLVFLALACNEKEGNKNVLQTLIPFDPAFYTCRTADLARNAGAYSKALHIYDSLISNGLVTGLEQEYAKLNSMLCHILNADSVNTTGSLGSRLKITWREEVLRNILCGILESRNGKSGLPWLHKARKALMKNNKSKTFEYFLTLESIGWHHLIVDGQTDSARFYYRRSLSVARSFKELYPHIPELLFGLAKIALINRDEISGLDHIQEALQTADDEAIRTEFFILKGTLLRKLGKYDSSEFYYIKAHEIINRNKFDKLLPKLLSERILKTIILNDDSSFYSLMNSLAVLPPSYNRNGDVNTDRLWGYYYLENGDPHNSTQYYEKALDYFHSCKTPDLVQVMEAFYALTDQYTRMKNYDKAEQYIYKALVYNSSFRDQPRLWNNILHHEVTGESYSFINYDLLADIYLARYNHKGGNNANLKKSLFLYRLIDSLMFEQVRSVEEDALIKFLSIGHKVYSGGVETCFHLYQSTMDTAYLNQAHLFMEKGKSLIMYRDILIRNRQYFPEIPAEFRNRELMMKARISALKKVHPYGSAQLSDFLKKMTEYYEEMESRYPRYYQAKYNLHVPSSLHVEQLSITKKMSVLQYHMTTDFLYFIKYDEPFQFGRIKIDSLFHDSLKELRSALDKTPAAGSEKAQKTFMRVSHYFYKKLIEPLHKILPKLLVIPDGAMNHIPFEILTRDVSHNFRNAPYLIKDHNINYASSFRVYELTAEKKPNASKKILGYAFTEGNQKLSPLPGTKKELESIQRIFRGYDFTVRYNNSITRERFLKDMELPFDIIHIGLHASSSISDRLENKIYSFSRPSDTTSAIYGFEIAPLAISANTVVLTSCQSGFGPTIRGEGAYSLARAFKQTGVTNVVSSLWDLTDDTTAEIIQTFYEQLNNGRTASESLAVAKRQYLIAADEITAHPYFWSGLVCQGN